MAGSQEIRLRHLIAGAQLEATIDKELQQWTDARDRLHDVGAALIAVSTPVSENLGQETVASALAAFKAVGEKVNERADDIQEIHQALRHAVAGHPPGPGRGRRDGRRPAGQAGVRQR